MGLSYKCYVLCAALMAVTTLYAQQKTIIKVHNAHAADKEVRISIPIDGNYFQENQRSSQMAPNKEAVIEFDINKEGMVRVVNDFRYVYVWVKPGDRLDVDFGPDNTYKISGANGSGQELYNKLYSDDTRSRYEVLEVYPRAEKRVEVCDSLKNVDVAQFKALLEQGKIDKDFYNRVQIEAELYYKLLLSTAIFFKMRSHVFSPEPDTQNLPDPSYLKVWQDIYSDLNTNADWIKSPLFNSHLGRYHSLLRLMNKPLTQRDLPYSLEMINTFKPLLKDETLEYAWATCIADGLASKDNEKAWLANWTDFVQQYPNSKLILPLKPAVEEVQDYHNRIGKSDACVEFLEDFAHINTLAELGERLKGAVAYVDLWATWCGPCRAELQYSIKLHGAMEKMGIMPVYLSIDYDNADAKWREMVQGYPLKGINLRANKALAKDIRDKVPGFNGIPRYLIFDKTGKIVNWDAKRPSDMDELLNQLKAVR
ncbi:TlpA family protein disulfide reductase [Sphingobacterium sp. xlx-130]|uniref:TlpA family protein disulfide reductase n=1 Tax=Sphingobacterium sp. xlx-130 TaxID=2654323 RepID=UPI0013DD6331|nr:TlpA disulfide reductase family protein [Sphingobacterium sp. xlx-130]